VYAVALAEGFGGGVLSAGVNALNRTVLPPESLGRANALLATVRQTLQLLGPALGALLYAGAGAHIVVLLDVVTFVLSAGCLARCVLPGPSTPEGADSSLKESALEGVRHVSRNPYLRHLLLTGAIFGLSIGFSEAIVFAVAQGVGRPAAFAGVLTSTEAVGSIGMGVLLSAVGAPLRELGKITAGLGCFACGMLLQTAGGLPLVLAGCVLVGAGSPLLVVGVTTAAQRRTPAALSGRLSGALGFAINVPFAFSIGLGAVLVGLVPYQVLLAGMSCGLILAACYALLTLREPAGRPDE
jgi:MFS family permease